MDAAGDQKTRELRDTIYSSTDKIEANNQRIDKIDEEITFYQAEIEKAKAEILSFADTEKCSKS